MLTHNQIFTKNMSSRTDVKYLEIIQNIDTSLCSDVLLRACSKNDKPRWVNYYIIALLLLKPKLHIFIRSYLRSGFLLNEKMDCIIFEEVG